MRIGQRIFLRGELRALLRSDQSGGSRIRLRVNDRDRSDEPRRENADDRIGNCRRERPAWTARGRRGIVAIHAIRCRVATACRAGSDRRISHIRRQLLGW